MSFETWRNLTLRQTELIDIYWSSKCFCSTTHFKWIYTTWVYMWLLYFTKRIKNEWIKTNGTINTLLIFIVLLKPVLYCNCFIFFPSELERAEGGVDPGQFTCQSQTNIHNIDIHNNIWNFQPNYYHKKKTCPSYLTHHSFLGSRIFGRIWTCNPLTTAYIETRQWRNSEKAGIEPVSRWSNRSTTVLLCGCQRWLTWPHLRHDHLNQHIL